jgi:hypothetical protein
MVRDRAFASPAERAAFLQRARELAHLAANVQLMNSPAGRVRFLQ